MSSRRWEIQKKILPMRIPYKKITVTLPLGRLPHASGCRHVEPDDNRSGCLGQCDIGIIDAADPDVLDGDRDFIGRALLKRRLDGLCRSLAIRLEDDGQFLLASLTHMIEDVVERDPLTSE